MHIRARAKFPYFKIVLITNGSGLDLPDVEAGLALLTSRDEVWVKLDAGTQTYMDTVNRTESPLEKIPSNILLTARKRTVLFQNLFSFVDGSAPPDDEIRYVVRWIDSKRTERPNSRNSK